MVGKPLIRISLSNFIINNINDCKASSQEAYSMTEQDTYRIPTVTIFILIGRGRGSSLMINFDDIPSRRDRITYSIKYLVELQDFRPFLGK